VTAPVLDRAATALIVVDIQEAFRTAVLDFDRIAARSAILVQGAHALGVPVLVTEQYPKGLGATVPEVAEHLDGEQPIDKLCFSAVRADGFDLGGARQAVVCGIEAHVCVNQTVADLLDAGTEVHVAVDAVSSRSEIDRDTGINKMERSGAVLTTVETALLELVGAAGSDEFKRIQGLIR
jgi:nicotinamidase-related amidase